MSWSTREIAELSGITVKTVRYYHEIGLLEEPDRKSNGYKQYEVRHLVRLLQIKRLTGLGVGLTQIAAMGTDLDGQASVFRVIDTELEATIERLQGIRRELAVLSQPGAVPDVPPGFNGVAEQLRDNDRALLMIYSQLFSDESMETVRQTLEAHPNDALDEAFRDLPEDADEVTRQALAEQLAPLMNPATAANPVTLEPQTEAARATAGQALQALYNSAQLDVLRRAHQITRLPVPEAPSGESR
ncbi:transcriptional regulator, MerR family protein [Actinoplanes italicus]|uniref:DNA-binding transcriptional MerR regulator n=1 Tax=Actinoplanes italicus TaxID=113567 RepID=A0A2T0JEF2_9ACTN|nr:MerR family transcriptional regulator [Actinoplanes italicus]PRX05986.1 DNA-binding transcriptional MerR regulator [Actinoplanes italicus]GIE36848.1 transcriptional regulator, MerR family protein [Actinoplanes italicus]